MKAPNGYGGISKQSGRRRKPYVVRLTMGYDDRGYPIYKILGYYKTRTEAMLALADYHKQPYDVDTRNMTTAEIFDMAYKNNKKLSAGYLRTHLYSFRNHIQPKIGDVPYHKINLAVMQSVVDSCEAESAKKHTRDTFSFIDKYAMEHDIIMKSYAQFVELAQYENKRTKKVFTYEEIAKLWKDERKGSITAKVILLYLYTGFRRNELVDMTKDNIKDNCFIGGSKTKAGKNRIVPIHSKIQHIVKEFIELDNEYLLPISRRAFFTTTFFDYCKKELGIRHIPHECRHTFITELNKRHADSICIDRLAGHASGNVGHDVYTHKTIEELSKTIELIKYK